VLAALHSAYNDEVLDSQWCFRTARARSAPCLTMPRSCSTTMRADDSVLVGEHSPLLADSTSGEKIRARVSRDESASQAFNRRPGLFAIGAVAVCGVLALANGT